MNIRIVYIFILAIFSVCHGGHDEEEPAAITTTCGNICEIKIKDQMFPLSSGRSFVHPNNPCITYHCNITTKGLISTVIDESLSCPQISTCDDGKPPFRQADKCCLQCQTSQFNERRKVVNDRDEVPVLDTWSAWSKWTDCSRSCGGGRQSRSRVCLFDNRLELNCSGKVLDLKDCNTDVPCPVDGGWSEWSEWSACSLTCNNGTQTRQRTCSNPSPLFGGDDCDGQPVEVKQCSLGHCPIDCKWQDWKPWGSCSVSCGGGRQIRKRFYKPAAFQGKECVGKSFELRRCNIENCPINGGWSKWSTWSECPVTCGGSFVTRDRNCDSPIPQYGGNNCHGNFTQIKKCGTNPCPVDCAWGAWSEWSACNATCDGGMKYRNRNWTNAMYGGQACEGLSLEYHICNTQECPNPCRPNPCYHNVKCDILSDTEYKCGSCPNGMRGNGSHCTPINECEEANPCSPVTTCIDFLQGYECTPCPSGYTGVAMSGSNLEDAISNKQVCIDIDECGTEGNHKCDLMRTCINTEGSYMCSDCPDGFVNRGIHECTLSNPCAVARENDCEKIEYCNNTAIGEYTCNCPLSMIGNGKQCVADSDSDGIPDTKLTIGCSTQQHKCNADNCKNVPNSGQEDSDGDGIGDACDSDMDSDGIINGDDNCIRITNRGQEDSDGDGIGDACDNCPNVINSLQKNLDGDEYGDACDDDMDGDGIPNNKDSCELLALRVIADSDNDGVGDLCDNCPNKYNRNQEDHDQDGIGDLCDNDWDFDKDGVQRSNDNCKNVNNADQLDTDGDGKGDLCDNDDDNDNIPDEQDICPLLAHTTDCSNDYDGDGISNDDDVCPYNSQISVTSFHDYFVVKLDPEGHDQIDPQWIFSDQGAEITQTRNSDPGMLIGNDKFINYRYSGTLFVRKNQGNDYVGIVLNYQSNKKFIVIMWKKDEENYNKNGPRLIAKSGVSVKVVNSKKGPSSALRNALWNTADTVNRDINVKTIYHHKDLSWDYDKAYRWEVVYIANNDCMRLKVYDGSKMLINSNAICGKTGLVGGKLGVFVFSQENIIWSDLKTECLTQPDELSILDKK